MKRIVFTITNDLSYDQRMNRICTSLANAGYAVTLIGILHSSSVPLVQQPFQQKRLKVWFFGWGKLFYLEYNLRLFFYLVFKKFDVVCGIDLDTLVPCFLISKIKGKPLVYDAHEYFSEVEEVAHRPFTQKIWKWIEKFILPKIKYAYTVNQSIADVFYQKHQVKFEIIRNLPLLNEIKTPVKKDKFIIYQGWVNHGRGLEQLVEAMKEVDSKLLVCGKGDIYTQLVKQTNDLNLQDKIIFNGFVEPKKLKDITLDATIGITFFTKGGLSNYYSLANRFFDYIHAGIPQITVDYPEYKRVNSEFEVALLIENLSPKTISDALNRLLTDKSLYAKLQQNCLRARAVLNWQEEEKKLLAFYKNIEG